MGTIFKQFHTLIFCVALVFSTSPQITQASDTTTINAADIKKELESADSSKKTQEQQVVTTAQSQGGEGFRFGGQIDGFSLNYVLFLAQYMAGAAMPVLCRNSIATLDPTGMTMVLPVLTMDNIIYSIASLMYLLVEILTFERIQKKKAELDAFLENLRSGTANTDSGSGTGAEGNRRQAADQGNLQVTALKAHRDLIKEQIRIIYFKEDAVRATKAGWLLSALIATISYVIWYTGAAATMMAASTVYMAPLYAVAGVSLAGAGAVGAAGATAAVAVTAGAATGVAVGAGAGAAASSSGQSPLASVGYGVLAGAGAATAIPSVAATLMGMPDLCAPFSVLAAGLPVGAWFNDNFIKTQELIRGAAPTPDQSSLYQQDFKNFVLPKITHAKDNEQLAVAMVEAQLMQKGAKQNLPWFTPAIFQQDLAKTLEHQDTSMIKKTLTAYYHKGMDGVLQTFFPLAQANDSVGLPGIAENSSSNQGEMPPASTGTAPMFEDPITGFQKDVNSSINTGNNISELSRDSDYLKDVASAKDAGELLGATVGKFMTFDFIKKFAAWLGFKNGGEVLLFFFLAATIDIAIFPSRAVVVVPPVAFNPYMGFFPTRIVNSLLGSFFAHGYYGELYQFRGQLEQSLSKLNGIIREMEAQLPPSGPTLSGVGSPGGKAPTGATIGRGDNSALPEVCARNGDFNPADIATCNPGESKGINAGEILDTEPFKQAFNLPEVDGGLAVGSLTSSFNNLANGNSNGARPSLNTLGSLGNAISKKIKKILDTANEKLPEAKVNQTLNQLAKDQIQLFRQTFKTAGVNFDKQATIDPFKNTSSTLAAVAAVDTKEKVSTDNAKALEELLKKANASVVAATANPWANKAAPGAADKGSELVSYTDADMKEALKNNYEYNNNDAINPDADKDIFKAITIRYFKTAYPQLLKNKKMTK